MVLEEMDKYAHSVKILLVRLYLILVIMKLRLWSSMASIMFVPSFTLSSIRYLKAGFSYLYAFAMFAECSKSSSDDFGSVLSWWITMYPCSLSWLVRYNQRNSVKKSSSVRLWLLCAFQIMMAPAKFAIILLLKFLPNWQILTYRYFNISPAFISKAACKIKNKTMSFCLILAQDCIWLVSSIWLIMIFLVLLDLLRELYSYEPTWFLLAFYLIR